MSKKITLYKRIVRFLIENKVTSLFFLPFYRIKIVWDYYKSPFFISVKWLFNSNETTNFTYDLTEINKDYMIELISNITQEKREKVILYLREVEKNSVLKNHIKKKVKRSKYRNISDEKVIFGRRIFWYIMVRILKPKVVVETGIDKGMGSCIISSALLRNKKEGFRGRYYGTDINPNAGFLFSGIYASQGEILYGDSITSLTKFNKKIDLFINDSDHSSVYEYNEYKTVSSKLSKDALIISDNAHCTDSLLRYARENNFKFWYFQEKPKNHWYPYGAGVGIVVKNE